jgi:hypothetical protein
LSIFYRHIFLLIALTGSIIGFGQQQNLPLNREFNLVNQKVFNDQSSQIHTSFLPLIQSKITTETDSILTKNENDYFLININKTYRKDRSWIIRKAFFENLIIVDTGNFHMTIDPLFNIEVGADSDDESGNTLYKNTRGAIIRANVGEKFSIETSVYENQMVLPIYLTSYVNSTGVVPGQGRVKQFKQTGFDFAASSATITYTPYKFLSLQMGTGKNFVGDGYRSLLLSDYSFNYPYFKITTTFGKKNQFQYTKLNASLSSAIRRYAPLSTPETLFQRKSMSTHYFSWLATKWLNIGFFESTLWQTEDSAGTKPFQLQQLNPVFGINTLTTVTDDVNHSNIGINTKIKLPYHIVLYNQFVMDGNQYEKTMGYQAGIRYSGINNLTLQTELNYMNNPYNSPFEPNLELFTNYNEPLTHPLGDNFTEAVGILNYKYKRVFTQLKVAVATFNTSSDKIMNIDYHLGYLINPKNNMTLILGSKTRRFKNDLIDRNTDYIYFGFRTNLRNLYDDF